MYSTVPFSQVAEKIFTAPGPFGLEESGDAGLRLFRMRVCASVDLLTGFNRLWDLAVTHHRGGQQREDKCARKREGYFSGSGKDKYDIIR